MATTFTLNYVTGMASLPGESPSGALWDAVQVFATEHPDLILREDHGAGAQVTVRTADAARVIESARAMVAEPEKREYALTIGENVRRYTEYRVMLTAEQAEALTAREQQEVDTDPDVMDLLGYVTVEGAFRDYDLADADNPETAIIRIDLV